MTIRPLGDSALILSELEAPPATVAAMLAGLAGVRDAVASYETVGVYFEAGAVTVDDVVRALLRSDFAASHFPLPPGSLADSLTDLPHGGGRFGSSGNLEPSLIREAASTLGAGSELSKLTSPTDPLPSAKRGTPGGVSPLAPLRMDSSPGAEEGEPETNLNRKIHTVPVCYELGPDLTECAKVLNLTEEELIQIHLSQTYNCFAVGFTPGFPYLGYLPERIATLPRKKEPRTRVEKGSIGITGKQTGIYPDNVPGGWNLIGQTPLEIVNLKDNYFPIEAGDKITFTRITQAEIEQLKGKRL